jgi:hypothetical protein
MKRNIFVVLGVMTFFLDFSTLSEGKDQVFTTTKLPSRSCKN